jgi:soluble lytic murein transglycosylase-like protein
MKSLGALALFALWLAGSALQAQELVIFAHGSRLRVERYQVQGETVRLELPSGGVLAVPLVTVERIIDDPRFSAEPLPEEPPAFSIAFAPHHGMPAVPYGDLIYRVAQRNGLNPQLLAAMVRAESAFDAAAVSAKGAQGLLQLMPATALRFGVEGDRVFDPETNLEAGARYLSWLAERFDHQLPHVLAAYNAGEGAVERHHGVPPYRETRAYLERIYRTLGLDPEPLVQAAR